MRLIISKDIIDTVFAHAKAALPNEACGYLAGVDSKIEAFYPMTNLDDKPDHFSFDPKEQFAAVKQARNAGLKLLSVYHSHPETPARLSEEDVRLLNDPNTIYTIVSLKNPDQPDIKGYTIKKSENTIEIAAVPIDIL